MRASAAAAIALGIGDAIGLSLLGVLLRRRTEQLVAQREALSEEVGRRDVEILSLKRQLDEAALSDSLTQTRNRRLFVG